MGLRGKYLNVSEKYLNVAEAKKYLILTLATSVLYLGEKTRYSGLSMRLLISLIFFLVRRSNTLIEYTARSDLRRRLGIMMIT